MILERDCKICVTYMHVKHCLCFQKGLICATCTVGLYSFSLGAYGTVVLFLFFSFLISEFGAFQSTPEATAIFWMKWLGKN